MIIATAPGRCSLVGDPTDQCGGSVLACTTRERARCTLNTDVEDIVITVSGHRRTIGGGSDLIPAGGGGLDAARAVLAALEVAPGRTAPFHLTAATDIPPHAGLANSTALLATITGCVLAHLELRLNLYEVAELVRKIECDLLGSACGFQDHYMTVFGGLNFMDFRDKNSAATPEAFLPFATIEPLEKYVPELPLVLAHRPPVSPPGASAVGEEVLEIARLARAAKRALLGSDWVTFADLMNRNHAIQRDLGGSGEANEALIAAALAGGADGAKLAGPASGGTILALTHDPERTVRALQEAGAEAILYPHPCPGLTVAVEVTV